MYSVIDEKGEGLKVRGDDRLCEGINTVIIMTTATSSHQPRRGHSTRSEIDIIDSGDDTESEVERESNQTLAAIVRVIEEREIRN